MIEAPIGYRKALTIAGALGFVLALIECALALDHVLSTQTRLAFAFLTVGSYPLASGIVATVLLLLPRFRRPSRFAGALVFITLCPWLLGILFPLASYHVLFRPMSPPA